MTQYFKMFLTLFNSSEEPNLSRCSRLVLAGPTAHDGWLPVKVTCRLSKLKESKVVLVSSYWDHCQLFVPASSSLDKLPEKKSLLDKTNIFPLQIWIDVTRIADCHLDPDRRTIWSSTPWSTSSGILSSPRCFKAHSVPSTSTWELWSFEYFLFVQSGYGYILSTNLVSDLSICQSWRNISKTPTPFSSVMTSTWVAPNL